MALPPPAAVDVPGHGRARPRRPGWGSDPAKASAAPAVRREPALSETTARLGPQPDCARCRARQIANGRPDPQAQSAAAREHVRLPGHAAGGYQPIAQAARVSPLTVCRFQHGQPSRGRPAFVRIRAAQARRLPAVTLPVLDAAAARRNAAGSRRRLQARKQMRAGFPGENTPRQREEHDGE